MTPHRLRLAVVTSHPIQYQAPWFRGLAKELDLQVFFCHKQDARGQAAAGFGHAFEWDVPLLEGYSYAWLRNVARNPGVETFAGCDTPDIEGVLRDGRFDACLVNGWYLKSYVQAVRACRRLRIPTLMRGDSQLRTQRSRLWSAAKYWPYRWFLSRIDAHLYVGQANRRYLQYYGVPDRRLFPVLHFVDNERFVRGAEDARRDGVAERLRAEWGVTPNTTVFLFCGKLIGKKRPEDFVNGVASAARRGAPAFGVVVGSGPLEAELRTLAAAVKAPLRFVGFQNQSQMPPYYAAADCLVLPSDGGETWGLVVNEAMACGLPAIVSDAVGCAADLIESGRTGESYPLGHVENLADAIERLSRRQPSEVSLMKRAVRAKIRGYSCDAAVKGTVHAIEAVRFRRKVAA
jgi:glycosyltransferase involved in cell wall biosynthesis